MEHHHKLREPRTVTTHHDRRRVHNECSAHAAEYCSTDPFTRGHARAARDSQVSQSRVAVDVRGARALASAHTTNVSTAAARRGSNSPDGASERSTTGHGRRAGGLTSHDHRRAEEAETMRGGGEVGQGGACSDDNWRSPARPF